MGLLSGPGPTREIVDVDPGTIALLNQQRADASQSDQSLADKMNAGVGAAGNQQLQTNQQLNQSAAGMAQDPAMLQAIRNQYGRIANQDIDRIQQQNRFNIPSQRMNYMNQSHSSSLAYQSVVTSNYAKLMEAQGQAEMARAQMLASIFGVAGIATGMYLGRKKSPSQDQETPAESHYDVGVNEIERSPPMEQRPNRGMNFGRGDML